MRNGALGVVASVLLVGLAYAQGNGAITGTVLDENGSPVLKAKVHIAEKGVFFGHRVLQFHETDADGHFRIGHVPWGTYIVMVGKEDAGYPDTNFAFYSNNAYPIALLSEDSPTDEVTLKLGPKAGVLKVDPVTDAVTGKEIRLASVTLKRSERLDFSISASASQGRFLIPPLTDVLVEITAEGYKPWPGPDHAATDGRIFLHPEEVYKLQVTLQPQDPQSASSENKPN